MRDKRYARHKEQSTFGVKSEICKKGQLQIYESRGDKVKSIK